MVIDLGKNCFARIGSGRSHIIAGVRAKETVGLLGIHLLWFFRKFGRERKDANGMLAGVVSWKSQEFNELINFLR